MKIFGRVVKLCGLLISAMDGNDQFHALAALPPRK
jgi:hypothetical protein